MEDLVLNTWADYPIRWKKHTQSFTGNYLTFHCLFWNKHVMKGASFLPYQLWDFSSWAGKQGWHCLLNRQCWVSFVCEHVQKGIHLLFSPLDKGEAHMPVTPTLSPTRSSSKAVSFDKPGGFCTLWMCNAHSWKCAFLSWCPMMLGEPQGSEFL